MKIEIKDGIYSGTVVNVKRIYFKDINDSLSIDYDIEAVMYNGVPFNEGLESLKQINENKVEEVITQLSEEIVNVFNATMDKILES